MLYVFHQNLNALYNVNLVVTESDQVIHSLEQLALRKQVTPLAYKGSSKQQYFKVCLKLNLNYLKRTFSE